MIARRMGLIDASGIRKVFDLARNMTDPVNLSIGQPDFDVPEPVKRSAIESISAGMNRYTVTQGIPELHEGLKEHLRSTRGIEPEALLVTSGVSGGLVLAFLTVVDEGDEVVIPDPYFVMYKHLAHLAGGRAKFVDTYPDFRLRGEALRAAITSHTKMLVLNSPCNPTGITYSRDELEMAAQVAREHDLLVLSDEIYDSFCYSGKYASMASIYPKTLLMGGFSKSHAMTGWRLGYASGPEEIIAEMTKLQQFSFVCAPSFAQRAGVTALSCSTDEAREAYRAKRDLIYEGLKDNFEVEKPDGAFYIFPKAPWGTDQEFVEEAIRNNLLIIPGRVFSERTTHFRISYAATEDTLKRGIDILNRLARGRARKISADAR